MPTINTGRQGRIAGLSSATFNTARTTGDTVYDSTTANNAGAFGTFHSTGRGGGTTTIYRTYFYFDVSTITTTPSAASLYVEGFTSTATSRWIVVKSSAFGGNGGSALATSDFVPTFATAYSSFSNTWNTTSVNSISLNSTALTDLTNPSSFTVCLVDYTYDYSNVTPTTNISELYGIEFSTSPTAYLDITTSSGPSGVSSFSGILAANISEISGISYSNISEISGI